MDSTTILGKRKNDNPLDFHPTPPEATIALMKFIYNRRLMPRMVWECACGDYAMSKVIAKFVPCIATDIIYGTDFLSTTKSGADMIITNPPFSLAEKFILHGLSLTPRLALLLKCQYWHAEGRSWIFEKYPPAFVLPLTWRIDPTGGGNPTMSHLWTVWIPGNSVSEYTLLHKP